MEFTNLSKADLLNIATELQRKVEAQQHLAEAVDAKDREIVSLKNLFEAEKKSNKELNAKVLASQHLSDAVIAKDKEIIELVKLNNELKGKAGTLPTLEKTVKTLEETNKKLVEVINPYILNFRSLLKAFQGSLELGIEMEALLSESLKNKEANK
jgi:hypothetical protein